MPGPHGMDAVFHALAHDTRRSMLRRLAGGELTVGELAEPLAISLAAASKHVRVLERAGLVRRHRHGRENTLELSAEPLRDVARWISGYERFWNARLDRLEKFFAAKQEKSK